MLSFLRSVGRLMPIRTSIKRVLKTVRRSDTFAKYKLGMNRRIAVSRAHQVVEGVFGSFFIIEIIMRFMSFEFKPNALKDFWFKFDGTLVVMMLVCCRLRRKLPAKQAAQPVADRKSVV